MWGLTTRRGSRIRPMQPQKIHARSESCTDPYSRMRVTHKLRFPQGSGCASAPDSRKPAAKYPSHLEQFPLRNYTEFSSLYSSNSDFRSAGGEPWREVVMRRSGLKIIFAIFLAV